MKEAEQSLDPGPRERCSFAVTIVTRETHCPAGLSLTPICRGPALVRPPSSVPCFPPRSAQHPLCTCVLPGAGSQEWEEQGSR